MWRAVPLQCLHMALQRESVFVRFACFHGVCMGSKAFMCMHAWRIVRAARRDEPGAGGEGERV